MYTKYNEIYKLNRKLDKIYLEKYQNDKDLKTKNILELLVELGELCNESKCFKYWSIKKSNSEELILEYIDTFLMILCIMGDMDISLEDINIKEKDLEINKLFIYLFNKMSNLIDNYEKEIIKDIFVNFIKLGKILEIDEKDIIEYSKKKININIARLNDKNY